MNLFTELINKVRTKLNFSSAYTQYDLFFCKLAKKNSTSAQASLFRPSSATLFLYNHCSGDDLAAELTEFEVYCVLMVFSGSAVVHTDGCLSLRHLSFSSLL